MRWMLCAQLPPCTRHVSTAPTLSLLFQALVPGLDVRHVVFVRVCQVRQPLPVRRVQGDPRAGFLLEQKSKARRSGGHDTLRANPCQPQRRGWQSSKAAGSCAPHKLSQEEGEKSPVHLTPMQRDGDKPAIQHWGPGSLSSASRPCNRVDGVVLVPGETGVCLDGAGQDMTPAALPSPAAP